MAVIIPAIDLQNGEAVRLYKGDYGQKTAYGDPVEIAKRFEAMGARYLHVVDLDGAKAGNTRNLETIAKIRGSVAMPIQVGGGIRTAETAAKYLEELGINRVIIGTAAARSPGFMAGLMRRYSAERIVAGVDVRDGEIAVSGWTQGTGLGYLEYIVGLKALGLKYIVATDIARDGTLTSPNWEMYENITGLRIIVSGGVASDEDIAKAARYYGVIVGKAYYEGKVDLEKCLKEQKG
jgi:phosphoribosylformimino-5-aminoimidazole carboxamide ribotide isomerase